MDVKLVVGADRDVRNLVRLSLSLGLHVQQHGAGGHREAAGIAGDPFYFGIVKVRSGRRAVVPEHADIEMINFRINGIALHRQAGKSLLAGAAEGALGIVVEQARRKCLAGAVAADHLDRAV